jgi:SAM-dependent methyltransferase
MGMDKRRWLELLVPPFRLRQRIEVLENTRQQLQEQVGRQVQSLEEFRQKVERRNGIIDELHEQLSKQQSVIAELHKQLGKQQSVIEQLSKEPVIEKLTKRVEALQRERDQVYEQYNSLLSDTLQVGESRRGLHQLQGGNSAEEYVGAAIQGREWRLNMGCGKRKKVGYLNVDVDVAVKPDMVVLLGPALPFASGTFSLIEAYHVVEHVYPWVSSDIFKEFLRILKPGGKLAIECPNIEAACAWLCQNLDYGPDSQMGMWAIYGDPNPQNRLHMHKWGYTPVTLSACLKQAGFVGIKREVPETHVPARDLRMTAAKPV